MKSALCLIILLFECACGCLAAQGDVYSGKPLNEALYDLARSNCFRIAHVFVSASPLERTDVFHLPDGRLLAITSRSRKLGKAYTIEVLRITPSAKEPLTKRLPPMSGVDLSKP